MKLELHNFMRYESETIEIPDTGITLIKGRSGIGKTTILEAITYALFGKIKDPINWNAGKNARMWVRFTHQNMTIYRQKNPGLLRVYIREETNEEKKGEEKREKKGEDRKKKKSKEEKKRKGGESDTDNDPDTDSDDEDKFQGTAYEDKVAEQLIKQRYGDENMWYLASYLSQFEHCPLLSGTNAEKMAALNQLHFRTQDPEQTIIKIGQHVKLGEEKLAQLQAVAISDTTYYTKTYGKINVSKACKPEELKEKQKELEMVTKEVQELTKQHATQEKLLGQRQVYLERQTKLSKEEAKIEEELLATKLEQGLQLEEEENLVFYQELSRLLQEYLVSSAKEQKGSNQTRELFTEADLQAAKYQEHEYWEEHKKAKDLGVTLNDFAAIQNKVNRLKEELAAQPLRNYLAQLDKAKQNFSIEQGALSKLLHVPEQTLIDLKTQVDLAEQAFYQAQAALDILLCPHCEQGVRYLEKQLVKAENHPSTYQEFLVAQQQLNAARDTLSRYTYSKQYFLQQEQAVKAAEKVCQELEQLHSQEAKDSARKSMGPLLNARQYREQEEIIRRLQNLKTVELPKISAAEVSAALQRQKNQFVHEKIVQKLTAHSQQTLEETLENYPIQEVQAEIAKIQTQIQKQKAAEKKAHSLQGQLHATQKELQNIQVGLQGLALPTVLIKLKDITSKQKLGENLQTEIKEMEQANLAAEYQERLKKQKTVVKEQAEQVEKLQRLKNRAQTKYSETLEEVVRNINAGLNDILSKIFEEAITAELQLCKTDKEGNKRLQVNLRVVLDGIEYPNLKKLSGGQWFRLNLAFLLALGTLSGAQLCMLDERFAYLDTDLKEQCLECIRQYAADKTVIIIDHQSIDGFYDSVLNREK